MERTLILLKPDCVSAKICGKIISRIEDEGLTIRGCKMLTLTSELLAEHYAHIADKPFYPTVEEFMSSYPVVAMVLEGDNVIARFREMLGATDCLEAAPGTIRAEYGSKEEGKTKMVNVVHASDSPEAAAEEIARFFSVDEVFEY